MRVNNGFPMLNINTAYKQGLHDYFYQPSLQRPATPAGPTVIDRAVGDVTGHGKLDEVTLSGVKTPDSPFIQQIRLTVKEAGSSSVTTIPLPEASGYNPTIQLVNFTGKGYKDILVQIDSGGSGATTYDDVYHYENGAFRHIFNSNFFNTKWKYKVEYLDQYKLRVISEDIKRTYTIDIKGRGRDYLDQIYKPDGQLKKPVEGFVDPISGLSPVDLDRNGTYSIMTFQGVSGLYHADRFGYIITILSWNGNGWKMDDQWFGMEGM